MQALRSTGWALGDIVGCWVGAKIWGEGYGEYGEAYCFQPGHPFMNSCLGTENDIRVRVHSNGFEFGSILDVIWLPNRS